jgi:hypothetical protein
MKSNIIRIVGFEFLAAVSIKIVAFWDVTPCSLVDVCRSFGKPVASCSRILLNKRHRQHFLSYKIGRCDREFSKGKDLEERGNSRFKNTTNHSPENTVKKIGNYNHTDRNEEELTC